MPYPVGKLPERMGMHPGKEMVGDQRLEPLIFWPFHRHIILTAALQLTKRQKIAVYIRIFLLYHLRKQGNICQCHSGKS